MKRYDALDGIRSLMTLGIVLFYVTLNLSLKPETGILWDFVIPLCGNLTLMFLIISSFSMCCGYYEKIKFQQIDLNLFYIKRYKRILPFFAILTLLAFFLNPNIDTLYESITNITLTHGFLPAANRSIIGVGWFIGTIFVFYMLFPFFVFLNYTKKRTWIVACISIVLYTFTTIHFSEPDYSSYHVDRQNIIISFMYLMSGALIFQYKDKIFSLLSNYKLIFLIICCISTAILFLISWGIFRTYIELIIFIFWIMYGIIDNHSVSRGWSLLNNKTMKFLSNISMEIYLSHMVLFRVVEKVNLERYIFNQYVLLLVSFTLVIILTIVFAYVLKNIILAKIIR